MFKNKFRRVRLQWRDAFDHQVRGDRPGAYPPIIYKKYWRYSRRNPISDAEYCDDGSYIPFRYIKGTIHLCK